MGTERKTRKAEYLQCCCETAPLRKQLYPNYLRQCRASMAQGPLMYQHTIMTLLCLFAILKSWHTELGRVACSCGRTEKQPKLSLIN